MFIDPDGLVNPSCECKNDLGNILTDSFEDIWNGDAMRRYRGDMMKNTCKGWCAPECVHGLIDVFNVEKYLKHMYASMERWQDHNAEILNGAG